MVVWRLGVASGYAFGFTPAVLALSEVMMKVVVGNRN